MSTPPVSKSEVTYDELGTFARDWFLEVVGKGFIGQNDHDRLLNRIEGGTNVFADDVNISLLVNSFGKLHEIATPLNLIRTIRGIEFIEEDLLGIEEIKDLDSKDIEFLAKVGAYSVIFQKRADINMLEKEMVVSLLRTGIQKLPKDRLASVEIIKHIYAFIYEFPIQ